MKNFLVVLGILGTPFLFGLLVAVLITTPHEALGPIAIGVLAIGGIPLLVGGGLAGWYGLAILRQRSRQVWADAHGIFPVLHFRVGSHQVLHDPNRQAVATVIYTRNPAGQVLVLPVILDSLEDAAQRAVAQAATVQAIRAGVSGAAGAGELTEHVQGVAQRLFGDQGAGPVVKILGAERIARLDRLLEDEEE